VQLRPRPSRPSTRPPHARSSDRPSPVRTSSSSRGRAPACSWASRASRRRLFRLRWASSHPVRDHLGADDASPSMRVRRRSPPPLRSFRRHPARGCPSVRCRRPRLRPSCPRRTDPGPARHGADGAWCRWTRPTPRRRCARPHPAGRRDRPPAGCRQVRVARSQGRGPRRFPRSERFPSSISPGLRARVRLAAAVAAWAHPSGRRSRPSWCRWTNATCRRRRCGPFDRLYARAREPRSRSPAALPRAREALRSGRAARPRLSTGGSRGLRGPAPRRSYLADVLAAPGRALGGQSCGKG
jgi:hypothetical protein